MKRLPLALQDSNFRLFWAGATVSSIGSQFTTIAMAWQIYQLTNSPLQIGLLGLGRAIPQIALSLVGGLLADVADRRKLLIVLQVFQCSISSLLMVLTLTGDINPQILFGAALLLAFGSSLESPPRQAIVPNLVAPDRLGPAIALNNTQRSIATVVGPSLAGVVLAGLGATWCYSIDALSWIVMLSALLAIKIHPSAVKHTVRVSGTALVAGLKFVRTQPVILSFMIMDFGATLFGASTALFPVFARDILSVGAVGLGLMYPAPSVGALLAAMMMSIRSQVISVGRYILLGAAAYALCVMVFALSHIVWLSLLLLAGSGAGNAVSTILRGLTNQVLTPDELRGRVAAVNAAFVSSGPQLGQFESGVVAGLWGARVSAFTGGAGAAVFVFAVALIPAVRTFSLRQKSPEIAQQNASG